MCRCCPGRHLHKKTWATFATSSVEGPEKTLRCRWGNSNTRIQYVRNYLAHTRISCGKFLRFSTKSEKQNVSVLYSNMVYLCRYRKFTVFYPSVQILRIFFRLFDFLGGCFQSLDPSGCACTFYASARSSVVLKNAKKGCRGKLCIRVWLLQ